MRTLIWFAYAIAFSQFIFGQQGVNGTAPTTINHANAPDFIRRQGIIFIYEGSALPCSGNNQALPIGTGFIVAIPTEAQNPNSSEVKGIRFLITAEHVVHGRSSIVIRYNISDGTAFGCHPLVLQGIGTPLRVRDNVDLVAAYVPGDIPDFRPYVSTELQIASREIINHNHIKEGWAVYAVGYFLGNPGQVLNMPISRFGTIDRLSDDLWYRSPPPRAQSEKGWLIEINAVPGLSGSPVFIREVQLTLNDQGQSITVSVPPLIIGVVKGAISSALGPEGVAVLEPSDSLTELFSVIRIFLRDHNIQFLQ